MGKPSIEKIMLERGVKFTRRGDKGTGVCPFHEDKKPSLSIDFEKNLFFCHACEAKGDSYTFLQLYDNVDFKTAKKMYSETINCAPTKPDESAEKIDAIIPVPYNAPNVFDTVPKPEKGAVYTYMTDDSLAFYVFRHDRRDGSKSVYPVCFTSKGWQKIWPSNLRPLYLLPGIKKQKDLPVVIVEGEKAADAAAKLFYKKYAVTTWSGGSAAVSKTDWTPLKNRNVIVCPDNDEPGKKAAEKIVETLKKIGAATVAFFTPPDDWPKGADWADFTGEKQKALEILNERIAVVYPDLADSKIDFERDPFRGAFSVLGKQISDSGKSIELIMHIPRCGIVYINPAEITAKELLAIHPEPKFWLEFFPAATGTAKSYPKFGTAEMVFDVIQIIMSEAEKRGEFSKMEIRGRGVWKDESKIVVHAGEKLWINGEPKDGGYHTKTAVYNKRPKINLCPNLKDFTERHAKLVVETCRMIQFQNPADNVLFAGWLALAPMCGVLPWRPHLWITGPAQTGKSWTVTFAKKLLSNIHFFRQGESTTEAALRQEIGNDALPVIFDEADVSPNKQASFQNIMAFVRAASSPDSPAVSKGTVSGKHVTFACRSMFLFASVMPNVFLDQDKSRFCILEMKKTSHQPSGDAEIQFKNKCNQNLNEISKYAAGYFAFIYQRFDFLTETINKIVDNFVRVGMSKRQADQYGTLAAGFHVLSGEPVESFLDAVIAHAQKQNKNRFDVHKTVIDYILDFRFDRHDVTVAYALQNYLEFDKSNPEFETAKTLLASLGLAIDHKKSFLLIPPRNPQLEKLFRGTEFQYNYYDLLARIDGAEKNVWGRNFEKRPGRFLKIPIEKIIADEE